MLCINENVSPRGDDLFALGDYTNDDNFFLKQASRPVSKKFIYPKKATNLTSGFLEFCKKMKIFFRNKP